MARRGIFGVMVLNLFVLSCATDSTGSLPATGQGDWYRNNGTIANCDDFSGFDGLTDVPPSQDGRIMAGCPMEGRFEVVDGAVVRDTCTNLTWQKVPPSATRSWSEALVFARDLTLAGFEDWRVPNVHELLSIVHYGRSEPALDPAFLFSPSDDVLAQPSSQYWSSTSSNFDPRQAWIVSFAQGDHFFIEKTTFQAVRAVRGGQIPFKLPVAPCPGGLSP